MEYSEFEIQAEVYTLLKSHFPLVRGEYFYEPVDRRLDPYGRIKAHRFDVVVFNEHDKILAVVEVKKRKGKHNVDHYKKSVLAPVLIVEGMHNTPRVVQNVSKAISDFTLDPEALSSANEFMRHMSAYV